MTIDISNALNNLNISKIEVKLDETFDYVLKQKEAKKQFKILSKIASNKDIFDKENIDALNIVKTHLETLKANFETIESVTKKVAGEIKIPKVFNHVVKLLGKVKIDKTGNKALDTASALTHVVLWGNVGKEVVGTAMYTVQALTNEDLPKDKRKFVGMYDLAVGVVSTCFSFIFGVGLENTIKNGYKKLLKPLAESENLALKSRSGAAIVGLAAFSSFILQTIVGKRMVAPAVATPVAGKLKKKLEERENGKKPVDLTATDLNIGFPKVGDNSQGAGTTNLLDKARALSVKA
ncbi:MAG TPA: hypothetical protein PKI94_01340 [Candidatus Gastranaerophilaceae bacterium]|nr:hypothetical protein [Candidatus Gastranaerophilaceae bacterium]